MKKVSVAALLFMFILTAVAAPTPTFAKHSNDDDDDRYEYRYDDDSDDDDDRDDDEDDRDDDDSDDSLEVEADVFTDTTIVKVELRNGQKTTFTTTADTRAEVIDVVAKKFNLSESEVAAALDFEIENRASRTKERAKISDRNNRPIKMCDNNSSSALEIEADIFTDTTIVKVERNNTKTVFETDATTTNDIVEEVAERFTSLTETQIRNALDIDVENRASRSDDFRVSSSSNSNDDCDDDNSSNNNSSSVRDAELKARITQLQTLIEALMRLLDLRLNAGN